MGGYEPGMVWDGKTEVAGAGEVTDALAEKNRGECLGKYTIDNVCAFRFRWRIRGQMGCHLN